MISWVDRGALSVNELRSLMTLPPVPGGDVMVRRLDTAPVDGDGTETTEGGEEE